MPLGMAALAELGMLVWWLGYYPGLLAYDSIDYTWEVTTGHWVDDHSIAYDGAVWLSLQLTGDYALLTLAQTITMAFIIGYLAAGLRKFRVPPAGQSPEPCSSPPCRPAARSSSGSGRTFRTSSGARWPAPDWST